MPTEILMPALSPTMTEGNLAKWLKQVGDKVEPGDVIAEIETDKATMEVEAVDEGKLGKILIEEGTEGVAVNTPIAVLLGDGEVEGDISDSRLPRRTRMTTISLEDQRRDRKGRDERSRLKAGRSRPARPLTICPRRRRSRAARRHRDGQADRARGPARCHGRGDARR